MFTLAQLQATHATVKNGADFPRYVQDMRHLGVVAYDHYVSDGHIEYFGIEQHLIGPATGAVLQVQPHGDHQALAQALAVHQQGLTDYPTFCRQAAEAGVEKWTTRTVELTCAYYDRQGQVLIQEAIPLPQSTERQ